MGVKNLLSAGESRKVLGMIGWIGKLSDLHVKFVTMFERLDALNSRVGGLADDLDESVERLARLEGVVFNNTNPELLRQLSALTERVTALELNGSAPKRGVIAITHGGEM